MGQTAFSWFIVDRGEAGTITRIKKLSATTGDEPKAIEGTRPRQLLIRARDELDAYRLALMAFAGKIAVEG